MHGYSKIKSSSYIPSDTSTLNPSCPIHENPKAFQDLPNDNNRSPCSTQGGGRVSVELVLSRSCSSTSHRYKVADKGNGGRPNVMRRAFSLRRSSPNSEKYCRLHDGGVDKDEKVGADEETKERSTRIRKRVRILRACKRVFGL